MGTSGYSWGQNQKICGSLTAYKVRLATGVHTVQCQLKARMIWWFQEFFQREVDTGEPRQHLSAILGSAVWDGTQIINGALSAQVPELIRMMWHDLAGIDFVKSNKPGVN